MKTNLLFSQASALSKRLAMLLTLLLTVGVGNAWAASEGSSWYDWASSENVYFDNTNSSYSNVSMLIGRQWNYGGDGVGSSGVNFTKVANTNNLYHAATTWDHYNTLLFMDAKDWGWETNKVTARYTYASNYTNTNNVNINGTELFYAASSTKGATLNHENLSGYAALNSRQTIQSVVDGTVANSKATISITSYKMTAHKTTTEQTATLGTGADASYIDAARTAKTTLELGTVATGYQFDGWYAAKTGGTALSTSDTYTYYPTAATTVYARFSTKQHTILFGKQGNGTITANIGNTSISSNSKVNYGSTIVFTATPSTGYQIEGWYSKSDCTNPINNGTNNTYTVTITGGTNVYVKFKANTYTVTLNQEEATTQGTTTVTATYDAAMPSITLPTRTGYTFNGYYDATSGGTKYYNADGTSAKNWDKTSATTLYAQWTGNKYTITWVVDAVELTGAQLDGVTTIVNHDEKITTAPKVVVEDYCGDIFVGWTDAVGGEYVHGTSNLYTTDFPQITNNTTLYAVFADYKK